MARSPSELCIAVEGLICMTIALQTRCFSHSWKPVRLCTQYLPKDPSACTWQQFPRTQSHTSEIVGDEMVRHHTHQRYQPPPNKIYSRLSFRENVQHTVPVRQTFTLIFGRITNLGQACRKGGKRPPVYSFFVLLDNCHFCPVSWHLLQPSYRCCLRTHNNDTMPHCTTSAYSCHAVSMFRNRSHHGGQVHDIVPAYPSLLRLRCCAEQEGRPPLWIGQEAELPNSESTFASSEVHRVNNSNCSFREWYS